MHVVYAKPLTIGTLLLNALTVLLSLLVGTLGGMLLLFFSNLYKRVKLAEQSSVNLLNGMHEGILILSHTSAEAATEARFLYANRSAQKLITKFVGPLDQCRNSSPAE